MRGMEKYVYLAFAIVLAVGAVCGFVAADRARKREATSKARELGARVDLHHRIKDLHDRLTKEERDEQFRHFMRDADALERMRK